MGGSSSSWCVPETHSLNSRRPRPRERPASGRRFGPNTTRATIRTRMSSPGPIWKGIVFSLSAASAGLESLRYERTTRQRAPGDEVLRVVRGDLRADLDEARVLEQRGA